MTVSPIGLAVTAALTGLNMALQMSRKIEGPRLDDLTVTLADYGTPLNYFYGTRRFEGCPIFWAEPMKEIKRKRKTKGGKYNEYTYYGTWAFAIAGHEIDGVTRMWWDKHLVYDATGSGPITPFTDGDVNWLNYIRFYLGSATQEPDPRMLATVEAEHGVGSCPAYRGTAYGMVEDAPLEKLGNRIPQVMVEAARDVTESFPFETRDVATSSPNRLWGFTFSPDYSRAIWSEGGAYEIWDVAARALMVSGNFSPGFGLANRIAISNNGTIYTCTMNIGLDKSYIYAWNADGVGLLGEVFIAEELQTEVWCMQDGNGVEHLLTIPWGNNDFWYSYTLSTGPITGLVEHDASAETGAIFYFGCYVTDGYGDIWGVGRAGSGTTIYLQKVVDTGARPSVADFQTVTVDFYDFFPRISGAHSRDNAHFVIDLAGQIYLIDDESFAVKDHISYGGGGYDRAKQWANLPPGASSIWLGTDEVSLADFSVIRSIDPGDWTSSNLSSFIYDPINHALLSGGNGSSTVTWRYLDRLSGGGVTLQSIANDIAARCNIAAGHYSFTALDQVIKGYSWVQGSGRDILEPLFDAHDSDLRPHDFTVEGKKRGDASGGTINVADFVRDGDTRYVISNKPDSDLPRALTLSFADVNGDQQHNSVVAQRPLDAVDSVRELSIDMTTMAEDADTARQLAERYFRGKWFGRTEIRNRLTMQEIGLEPGDVRTLGLDGESKITRMLRMRIGADGVIGAEWERDDPSIHVLSGQAGAEMDGRVEQSIPVPGLTKGVVLDVPLAVDAHDSMSPQVYYGAGPYSEDVFWAGADFQQADNDIAEEYDPAWAAVSATDAMDWGHATNALGDALSTVIDYGNTLTVFMHGGTLVSATEAAVLANGALNLVLVGTHGRWEYIQFVTATLVDTDTYQLSGLLRGRRGTEQHTGTHAVGDTVIPMGSGFLRRGLGASEIGDTDYYKAVSQGRSPSSAFTQALTFTGAANKPWSPVHGSLSKDAGTGDWTIDAVRRTRIGGANIDGQTVPLGEVSEAWEADIMDGADVVRTISGTSLPLTYTSAQAIADFGSNPASLDVNLYQMSPSLALRGYPLALAA